MKKNALIYGLIAGGVVSLSLVLGFELSKANGGTNQELGEFLGFAGMILSFSTIFMGVHAERKAKEGSSFSYWEGFRVGLVISLVASAIYVITWMVYSHFYAQGFMENYAQIMIEKKEVAGMMGDELEAYKAEMDKSVEQYENPFYKAGVTFIEIFPIGLLMSLVAAAVYRSKA